jgi:2-oxoisovalerate dehydrogenase E1 component
MASKSYADALRFLDGDGNLLNDNHEIDDTLLVELYRQMLRTRAFDEAAMRLQRIGRIPAYYPCAGQETHVAVASALEDRDWIFSQYREQGVRLMRGVPVLNELALWRGMPHAFWDPTEHRITPMNVTIATHLPQATGYGYGAKLLGKDEISLALFGDGATSEVDFHAALNFAGVWKTPTVFFCQNNRYAQSTPIEQQTASETLAQKAEAYGFEGVIVDGMDIIAVHTALDAAILKARSGDGPTMIESLCYRYTPHSTYDGTPVYRTREEEAEWKEKDPLVRTRAYLLNRGLIDEQFDDTVKTEMRTEVDAAIDELEAMPLPPREKAFRAVNSKMPQRLVEQLHEEQAAAGEALSVIEDDDIYSPGEEIEPTGERKALTLVEALNLALNHAMSKHEETINLGEDVGREGGVFRVTADMYEKYGADRMLDTPLCELGIIGTAIGMSMAGVRPVAEMEFAGFAFTAFDQMISHVARYSWRTVGQVRFPLVIRMPGGGGHEGYEGHSDSTEALFAHIPGGIQVVYPSNAHDAKGLLAAALESEDPVIFFEPIVKYFTRYEDVPVEHYTIPIGKARVARAGTDVTIVTYGNTVGISEQAAEQLESEGVSVEIVDLRSIKPWDEQCVLDSVEKTGRLVVAHEAARSGGFGAEIIATVMEKGGYLLETPPARVTHADMPWAVAKLEPFSMISPERIAVAVRKVMED